MRWRAIAAISVVGAIAAGAHAGELRATSIARGLEEPGRYSPANAFDGDPATAYCAPRAHLSFFVSDRDAVVLEQLVAIRISASDAGARTVDVHVYYPRAPYDATRNGLHATLDQGDTLVAIPATWDKHRAVMVDLDIAWAKPRAQPVCIADLTWLGATGPLELPDLRAAVEHRRAADRALAAAPTRTLTTAYLTAYDWIYLNPAKEQSTWESETYTFAPDGTYTSSRDDVLETAPIVMHGTWAVVGGKLRLNGGAGAAGWAITACAAHPGYLCGANFLPTAAW